MRLIDHSTEMAAQVAAEWGVEPDSLELVRSMGSPVVIPCEADRRELPDGLRWHLHSSDIEGWDEATGRVAGDGGP